MKKKNFHPLNSRKRMATISSLFSSGGGGGVLLPLVRLASRSIAVAPKHNVKSSVADYDKKKAKKEGGNGNGITKKGNDD